MSPKPLNELTRDPVDEAQLARNWRAIRDRRAGEEPGSARRSGARIRYGALGVALAAAAALLFVSLGSSDDGPLALADGGAFTSAPPGVTELADGSRIDLSEGGHLEVLESSAQRVVLRLADGRARFSVTPNGPRRWVIEAGARVEVVGTVFTVDRAGPRVECSVERGVVLVFHDQLADGVRRLTAGQRVSVGETLAAAPADLEEAARPEARSASSADVSSADVSSSDISSVEASSAVEPLAEASSTEAAPAPAAASGRPHAASARPQAPSLPTAAELMERADIARVHGDDAEAAEWLERILDRYPNDAAAAMAAYTLGNLELQRLRRPDRAVRAYERALRAGLPASSAETVRARRIEALMRAGRPEEARAAAEDYHLRYPSGRWTQEVDRWTP